MLNENIKNLRKAKGLSQEGLAVRLNVVRQTVSKWENGLSVPDSSMLIALAEALDTSVSTLLGEVSGEDCCNEPDIRSLAEKLETINLQLARENERKIKTIRYMLISLCVFITAGFLAFAAMQGEYLEWDYQNPEFAVAGTILHGIEFLFVRIAPFILIGAVIGVILTYRKR